MKSSRKIRRLTPLCLAWFWEGMDLECPCLSGWWSTTNYPTKRSTCSAACGRSLSPCYSPCIQPWDPTRSWYPEPGIKPLFAWRGQCTSGRTNLERHHNASTSIKGRLKWWLLLLAGLLPKAKTLRKSKSWLPIMARWVISETGFYRVLEIIARTSHQTEWISFTKLLHLSAISLMTLLRYAWTDNLPF